MVAKAITAFDTLMIGATTFSVHEGSLDVDGDFVAPTDNVLIIGDLTVAGKIATEDPDAGRYAGASLIVTGSVACQSIFNGEACLLLIAGDCIACSWVFGAVMDASFVVGGDFVSPIFFGSDIWVTVGGTTVFDYGDGKSLPLSDFFRGFVPGSALYARQPIAQSLALLDLEIPATEWSDDHINALSERYYDTGSILPEDGRAIVSLPPSTPTRAARVALCKLLHGRA